MNAERRVRGRIRPLLLVAGLALLLVAVTGWVGATTVFLPAHIRHVTGRDDIGNRLCTYCHFRDAEPRATRAGSGPRYVSPAGIAVSPDGRKLWVAASGNDRLLEIDLATEEIARAIDVPGRPHGVAVSADGRRVAVSSRDGDRVRVLDAGTLDSLYETDAAEPLSLALSGDGERLYVASGFSDRLIVVNPPGGDAVGLVAGNWPYDVALSRDGRMIAVANLLARPVAPTDLAGSEITLIDATTRRVRDRRKLESAHMGEGVALSSDGSFALATTLRFRNLLPLTQVARGAVMSSALVYAETEPGGRTVQLPLDEVNRFYADPSDVVLTPDDRIAFVSHGGARTITAVDVTAARALVAGLDQHGIVELADDLGASAAYVLRRIPTLDNPRELAVSPDGTRLFAAERLADSIAVIDTERLEVVSRISLGGPEELSRERLGERVFHDASGTFQGQFSCRSCHPDGHTDGLIWDFEIDGIGKNLLETRSLRGIRDTAPFKWNGKNPDLATQCGPRFARVLTRSDPFAPAQLENLVTFIESIPLPPVRVDTELSAAVERGREIFFRQQTNAGEPIPKGLRCDTCHRPPLYTDRLPSSVGTGGRFDTPHLFDVGSSAPYLHDGRARTLEEIWTVHSPEDTHGVTNDLTKVELNDLVVFLRSL